MNLPKLTDETWQCRATDVAQKRRLLQLAKEAGVALAPQEWGFADDNDLFINYWGLPTGIGVTRSRHLEERKTRLVSPYELELMCAEYAGALLPA